MVMMPPGGARPPGPPPPPPPGPGGPGGRPGMDPAFAAAVKLMLPAIENIMRTLGPDDIQNILRNGQGGPGGPMGRPSPMGGPGGPMGGPGGPGPMPRRGPPVRQTRPRGVAGAATPTRRVSAATPQPPVRKAAQKTTTRRR